MPEFVDISSIPLDKFQMQKNPTPKQDPTNNQFFFYFDCPSQGYPIKFNPMMFDSTGKPGAQQKTVTVTANIPYGSEILTIKTNVTPKKAEKASATITPMPMPTPEIKPEKM